MVWSVGCRQDAASAGAEKQRLAAQFEKQLAREVAHKSLAEILRQYGPREPPRYSRCNDLGCILLKMPRLVVDRRALRAAKRGGVGEEGIQAFAGQVPPG